MVIMSFRGCAKITCPLRWLLLLVGSECSLQKIVLLPPASGRRVLEKHNSEHTVKEKGEKDTKKKFYKDIKNN